MVKHDCAANQTYAQTTLQKASDAASRETGFERHDRKY